MAYENARAIVLGASGFIGRWIARTLSETAATYLVVRDAASFQKISNLYKLKGIVTEIDLTDFRAVEQFVRDVQPSIVFNFAGYGVDPAERDSGAAKLLNQELPRMLCAAIASFHDPHWAGQQLIQPGSALEYGIASGILSELTTPLPTTVYGNTKLEGTNIVLQARIRGVVPRLFNVYGPGEHTGRLLPSLFDAARHDSELNLTPGTQKRDFTYVEDIAEGCLKIGLLDGKIAHPINVATGRLHTVRQFVEIASRELNIPFSNLRFGALPFRKEELDHEGVSTDLLQKLIKWTPSTQIAEGIRRTIAFLKSDTE